jgi:hypothetical protein
MITGAVTIPKLFWQLDNLKVPRDPWMSSGDPYFAEAKVSFEFYLAEVQRQEREGVVDRTNVVNLLMSAWALKHNWHLSREPDLQKQVLACRETARKYGLTKIYDAAYWHTMVNRLEERTRPEHEGRRVSNCGRCGRELTAELSVKRGIGPICWGHRE